MESFLSLSFFQSPAARFFFSDGFVFAVVQFVLLGLFIYGGTVGRRRFGANEVFVSPDAPTVGNVVLAYSIISASVVQTVATADLIAGYKLIIVLADLWAVFYLCFFNSWFKVIVNEAVGYLSERMDVDPKALSKAATAA